MAGNDKKSPSRWRLIVVGGHTRSIGKTQLVCDVISAFRPANWIAGKITQYGHGVCAQNGENCGCAPDEHVCAINWETQLLRAALQQTIEAGTTELRPVIVESNSLLQFLKPSLYLAVVDPGKEDFKDSARVALDRADALVLRGSSHTFPSRGPAWVKLPPQLLRERPWVSQGEGEPLPEPLRLLVQRMLEGPASVWI
ncbi:MAG: hypothetical protein DMG51_05480 [Acidobacteria bacterium]|nr:MAG: hypothetical protein DMG51_05480 [Acidobacteriota bacterium]